MLSDEVPRVFECPNDLLCELPLYPARYRSRFCKVTRRISERPKLDLS